MVGAGSRPMEGVQEETEREGDRWARAGER